MKNIIYDTIILCRPLQWIKNVLIFSGLIFAKKLNDIHLIWHSLIGFIIFCLVSSAVYIINDIVDIKDDRNHPVKKGRPLAAGKLSIKSAALFCAFLIVISFSITGIFLNRLFLGVISAYFILMLLYSLFLKNIVIVDVIIVAMGFVIRAIAGTVLINVTISPWLILCTFLLALFIVLGKRRHELDLYKPLDISPRRISLASYTTKLLDQFISVVTSTTLMAYSLYTFDSRTIHSVGTYYLPITIPFVVYGIFRYLYLIHTRNITGEPERVLLCDKALLFDIIIWGTVTGIIIYH